MIAAWMIYATLVAALLAAGALALDRALRLAGRQARWVWVAALVASLALPLLGLRPTPRAAPAPVAGVVAVAARAVAAPVPRPSPSLASLDTPLIVAWAGASAVMLLLLLAAQRAFRRQTALADVREVDGQLVCVTPTWGPAVVGGLRRATIVLPSWVADLEPDARRLAVRHEAEHLATGDVRLLALGALAAAACPWNPAIWWQLARLKDAVELDCDHRLVRAGVDVGRYGALLLEVARRSSVGRLAPALAARPSLLARRIDHMTATPSSTRRLRAVLGAGLAALLVALACEAPRPVEDGTSAALDRQPDGPPVRLSGPALLYPPLLKDAGIEGKVVLEFVVDTTGRVDPKSIVIMSSTHKAFEMPAVACIRGSFYRPAIVSGVPAAVRTRQAVEFRIGSASGAQADSGSVTVVAEPPGRPDSATPHGPNTTDTTLVFLTPAGTPGAAPTVRPETLAVVVTPARRK